MSLRMILALCLGGVGCQSIYHEPEATYPPDPCVRLKLRIEQARQAQKQADQAAVRLRDRASKNVAEKSLEPDVDRLEMAAREFGRRMAVVTDALVSCEQSGQFAAEIQRLRLRCTQMLETVQLIRSDGLASTLPVLENLVHSAAQP